MDYLFDAFGIASPSAPTPSTDSAIQRCLDAWTQIMHATPKPDYFTQRDAGAAFRAAMPELSSLANVQNFIACVSRGILLGAIDQKNANKLLHAAQLALRAFRRTPLPPSTKKTEEESLVPIDFVSQITMSSLMRDLSHLAPPPLANSTAESDHSSASPHCSPPVS